MPLETTVDPESAAPARSPIFRPAGLSQASVSWPRAFRLGSFHDATMQPDMAPELSRLIIRQFVAPLASRKSNAALVRSIIAAAAPGVGREM